MARPLLNILNFKLYTTNVTRENKTTYNLLLLIHKNNIRIDNVIFNVSNNLAYNFIPNGNAPSNKDPNNFFNL